MTPYYEDDHCTIYHGDCLDLMPSIGTGLAHAFISDPPYFRVIEADWDDQWGADPGEFLAWLGGVLDQADRTMADRGTLAIFCAPDMACGVETEVRRRFAYLNHIVWRKPGPGRAGQMDKESMRRFFPTSERIILAEKLRNPDGDLYRFRDHVNHAVTAEVHEPLIAKLIGWRDDAGLTNRQVDGALGRNGMAGHYFGRSQWSLPTEDAWNVIRGMAPNFPDYSVVRQEFDARRQEFDARRREFDARRREFELLTDVWTFEPPPPSARIGNHPTAKPLALMSHIIQSTTRQDDIILDPFMGSGTTLRAAKDLGRKAIGIEIEERYCEIAAKRLAQEVLPL